MPADSPCLRVHSLFVSARTFSYYFVVLGWAEFFALKYTGFCVRFIFFIILYLISFTHPIWWLIIWRVQCLPGMSDMSQVVCENASCLSGWKWTRSLQHILNIIHIRICNMLLYAVHVYVCEGARDRITISVQHNTHESAHVLSNAIHQYISYIYVCCWILNIGEYLSFVSDFFPDTTFYIFNAPNIQSREYIHISSFFFLALFSFFFYLIPHLSFDIHWWCGKCENFA